MPTYGYLLNSPSVIDIIDGITFTRGSILVYQDDQPKLNAHVPDKLDRYVDGVLDNNPTFTDEAEACAFLGSYFTVDELTNKHSPSTNVGSFALVNEVLHYANGNIWTTFATGGLNGGTDLSYQPSASGGTVVSSSGLDASIIIASSTYAGLMTPSQVNKLSNIENNATADMTPTEIVSAVNSAIGNTFWQAAGVYTFEELEDKSTANLVAINIPLANALNGKLSTNNVKTINGESIVGSGNIVISGSNAAAYQEVLNFAALPSNPAEGVTYIVLQSSGVYLLNRKPAGLYRYSSSTWVYLGEVPDGYFTDSVATFYDDADLSKKAKFELGSITTNTTRTLTIPDASGTIALTSDARFSDARAPLAHSHLIGDLPNTLETITGSQAKADAAQSAAVTIASADASSKASARIPIGSFVSVTGDRTLSVDDNNMVADTGSTSRAFTIPQNLSNSFIGITVEGPCTWIAGSGVTLLEDRPTGTGQNFCQLVRVGVNKYRVYGERA